MSTRVEKWQERIQRVKEELMELGDMRPGALSEQYNVCGTAGCRCKDSKSPKKHGPYHQLSYTHLGKSTTEFVNRQMVPQVRQQLRRYAKFRQLTAEWVELSVKIAKAMKKKSAS